MTEYFSQSVGIGEDRLDAGMKKRRKNNLVTIIVFFPFALVGQDISRRVLFTYTDKGLHTVIQ